MQSSLDWLRHLQPLSVFEFKLKYRPLALGARILDGLNPRLYASTAENVGTAVKPCRILLFHEFKTDCACFLLFDLTQLTNQLLIKMHFAPQM